MVADGSSKVPAKSRLAHARPAERQEPARILCPARRRTYYYLYVLLDIFSRYVVGWLLAREESAALAKALITESCERQQIGRDQLVVHADRGPSMTDW